MGDSVEHPGAAPGAAEAPPSPRTSEPREGRYICGGCYFVYDEEAGLPSNGLAAGASFAGIPEAWRCPDCGSSKALFRKHSAA